MLRRGPRAGVAALEFALVAPVLLVLFLGTIDLSDALILRRRLDSAARAVATIASTTAAQIATENQLAQSAGWAATTAAFAYFPDWTLPAAARSFAITLSAIAFTASPAGCTAGCAYTGVVGWSLGNDLGALHLRPCGKVPAAPDAASASYTALPAGDFGATSVLVADIAATFHPTFSGFLIGDIPMLQSAAVSPRLDNGTTLLPDGGPGIAVICPAVTG